MSRAGRIHRRLAWKRVVKETPRGRHAPSWKEWRAAFWFSRRAVARERAAMRDGLAVYDEAQKLKLTPELFAGIADHMDRMGRTA